MGKFFNPPASVPTRKFFAPVSETTQDTATQVPGVPIGGYTLTHGDDWKNAKPGETVFLPIPSGETGVHYEATKLDDGRASSVYKVTDLPLQKKREDITDTWGKGAQDEGPVATFFKTTLSGIPSAGAGAAAMGAVQPIIQPLNQMGPWGRVSAGALTLGAGLTGAMAERLFQDSVTPDSAKEQAAVNAAANPKAQFAGEIASQLPFFRPGALARTPQGAVDIPAELLNRGMPAAIGGGIQGAQEVLNAKDGRAQDGAAGRILSAALSNAVLNKTTGLGENVMSAASAPAAAGMRMIGKPSSTPLSDMVDVAASKGTLQQNQAAANDIATNGTQPPAAPAPVPKVAAPAPAGDDLAALGNVVKQKVDAKYDTNKLLNDFEAENKAAYQQGIRNMGLSAEDSASAIKELLDAKDMTGKVLNYAGSTKPARDITLGELIGQQVEYAGYKGTLIREPDGTLSVLRSVTTDGTPNLVEVADTRKNLDMRAVDAQVNPLGELNPKSVSKLQSQSGAVDPSLLYHLGAPAAGAAVGYATGDTPEERRRNALIGALIGLGGTLSAKVASHLSETNPALLDRITGAVGDSKQEAGPEVQQQGGVVPKGQISNTPSPVPEIVSMADKLGLNPEVRDTNIQDAAQKQGSGKVPVLDTPGNGKTLGANDIPVQQASGARAAIPEVREPTLTKEVSEKVRASKEYRKSVNNDITTTLDRVQDSPSVDVDAKAEIARMVEERTGLGPEYLKHMTDQDLPIAALEKLRDDVKIAEWMGRNKVRDRRVADSLDRQHLMDKMESSQASKLEDVAMREDASDLVRKNANLIDRPSLYDRTMAAVTRKYQKTMDYASKIGTALTHRDVVMDQMDGGQNGRGFINREFGGGIDAAYNADHVLRDQWKSPLREIISKYKLDDWNMNRIGAYMISRQEGGAQRLKEMGYNPDVISRIKLTEGEQQYSDSVRKLLDTTVYPKIKELMRNEYNIDVTKLENYFPLQRDWGLYHTDPAHQQMKVGSGEEAGMNEIVDGLVNDFRQTNTTRANQGMTKERIEGAKTPVKVNAADVIEAHLNAASHLITHQKTLKMLGSVARSDKFAAKYGNVGQKYVLDILDTVARDGAPAGAKRTAWIDFLRNNTSTAVLGFRVLSQIKHLPNIGIALGEVGPNFLSHGLTDMWKPEVRNFIKSHFKEVAQRGTGEPSLAEILEGRNTLWNRAKKNSFFIERWLDATISRSTVVGAYMKELAAKGIDPSDFWEKPYDPEAGRMALYTARKVVTSPLMKDIPQAVSRGALTSGNMSAAKALFQFQNIMLRQAGYMKHDIFNLGVKKMNLSQFTSSMMGFLLMLAGETYIVDTNRKLLGAPEREGKEVTPADEVAGEALKRVPFAGNVISAVKYGKTGVPLADSGLATLGAAGQLYRGRNDMGGELTDRQKERNLVDISSNVIGGLTGVPGISTAAQVYKNKYLTD